MIRSYVDLILEEYIKLDAPLYLTKRCYNFFEELSNKGDRVAQLIILNVGVETKNSDVTWVDLTDKNDQVSFIQVNRILRFRDEELGDPKSQQQGVGPDQQPEKYLKYIKMWGVNARMGTHIHPLFTDKTKRTELNVGRFANKVLTKFGAQVTPNDINKFVENFRTAFEFRKNKADLIEIVSGDEIRHWYSEDNYYNPQYHLGSSCMRYDRCGRYLNIYVENPNQVVLAILRSQDDKDKIIGRALLWKLNDGEKYLDRPYCNNDTDLNIFKEWGKKNGYQVYGSNYNHKEVDLDKADFSYYPYMDTFKYLNRDTKTLSTDANEFDNGNQDWIRLEDTMGGYSEAERGVYSEYYGDYIDEDSAVWAEDIQSYVHHDDAYYLEYKDCYVHTDADVVYSEFDGGYYLTEDAIKSVYLDTYIYSDDALNVFVSIDEEDYVPESFKEKGIVREYFVDGSPIFCISANVFKSPFANEYFFRTGTIKVFTMEDGGLITQGEADNKDIDTAGLESDYMDIDEYLSKRIKPLTKDQFLEKVKSLEFTENQVNYFKRNSTSLLYSLGSFFSRLTSDEIERLMKLLIWLGYTENEKDTYGKPRRKNRKNLITDLKEQCEEFIKNERFYDLPSMSLEKLFESMDSSLSDYITDQEFLAQIILFKSNQ